MRNVLSPGSISEAGRRLAGTRARNGRPDHISISTLPEARYPDFPGETSHYIYSRARIAYANVLLKVLTRVGIQNLAARSTIEVPEH